MPGEGGWPITQSKSGIIARVRGIPRASWLLVLLGMFISLANGIFLFGFVLFLQGLGHDVAFQGFLISMMEVTVAATILPFGMGATRFGKRRMLVLGLVATSLSYLVISFASELLHFAMAMLLLGLGSAATMPALAAGLADTVCDADRKYMMSINAFASMLSSALAFLVSGVGVQFLGEDAGFRWMFRVGAAIVLLGGALLARGVEGVCAPPPERESFKGKAKKILPFILPNFVLGLGAGLVIPFFPVYFKLRFDASASAIGALFTITQLVWAFSYMAMPVVAEKAGSVKTLIVMQSMAVLALFFIPVSLSFENAALLFAVRMILMNASRPLADSYMMTLIGKDLRSTAVAANQMAWMVPHMASVAAGGVIMGMSLELPFFICGGFYIASTALYAYFFMGLDDAGNPLRRGTAPPPSE